MRTFSGFCVAVLFLASSTFAGSWNQWRGPNRDGVAPDSPPLTRLGVDEALTPSWISEPISSSFNGGWGSPVVDAGRVYVYIHSKTRKEGVELGKAKYPWLPPDKRGHLTPAEYEQYEVNRRDEDEERAKAEIFTETLYCFDAATGKTLWKNVKSSIYTRFVQSGTPTVVDGRVLVLVPGRKARCYDAAKGELLWETKLPGDFRDEFMMSSFAVTDGVAAVLAGRLVALDVKTGAILWEGDAKATRGEHSSPVVHRHGEAASFVANVAGDTASFDAKTGKEHWRVKSSASGSTPIVVGDKLVTYGSSRRGGLRCYQISAAGVEEKWVYSGAADQGSSPVVVKGYVYVQGERRLACIDLNTGDEKWTADLPLNDPRYTSLIAADDKILYALEGLLWFAADPTGYKPIAALKMDDKGVVATEAAHRKRLNLDELKAKPDGEKRSDNIYRDKVASQGPVQCTSPAIADGRLFVRLKNGIACYELVERNR